MDSPAIVPATPAELAAAVTEACATGIALEVVGGGTKRGIGRPDRQTRVLSTARFDGVVDYDPSELVLTVRAGTALGAIERLLAEHGQMLSFEPLLTGASGTIGGAVAAGLAGPRRVSAGNVRDHVLGFSAVSGRGECFVAGGRVVKNVTGFDLPKLVCGSWGQLAVLTEVTLKVVPRPRCTLTLWRGGLDEARALQAMRMALGSQAAVAAAAHLPARPDLWPAAEAWPTAEGGATASDEGAVTLFRLEGFGPSVEARAATLAQTLGATLGRLTDSGADLLWSLLRQTRVLEGRGDALWRVVTGADPLAACSGLRALGARYWLDWAGGVVHARVPVTVPGPLVRELARRSGGHALLLDAPRDYRLHTPARQQEEGALAALARQVRLAFDPAQILDPRRFEEASS
ncbi:FAD-binding protein [Bradyrhizobium sp.]|uniref:FAD-binding protein n=1 Tax=Bradyrhizobium sp. TaxID=376 RepID=UPI00260A01E2|nr:FAD-binding protein [Bradyrhizobium sp.]